MHGGGVRVKRIAVRSAMAVLAVAAVLAGVEPPSAQAALTEAAGSGIVVTTVTGSTISTAASVVAQDDSATVRQFWTPQRMASATSEDRTTSGGRATAKAMTAASVARSYPNSRPSIGTIFYAGKDLKTHYCTASVVRSPGKNLILMAAHCRPGSWMAFVPDYRSGASTQPYGVWAVQKVYSDSRFSESSTGIDYDFAFAKVGKDSKGRQVENVVNGNSLNATPGYNNWVGVTGYPEASAVPADRAITCWNHTTKVPGYSQMQFLCSGFYSGTSGSPWLIDLDPKTDTGRVIGLIGGLDRGGPNDWTSYSPVFGAVIWGVYNYANRH